VADLACDRVEDVVNLTDIMVKSDIYAIADGTFSWTAMAVWRDQKRSQSFSGERCESVAECHQQIEEQVNDWIGAPIGSTVKVVRIANDALGTRQTLN
jgi:hypothetical protein